MQVDEMFSTVCIAQLDDSIIDCYFELYPLPTSGCLVGMTVISRILAEYGRLAMVTTQLATSSGSMKPSDFSRLAISSKLNKELRTLPGLIIPTAIPWTRPSSASDCVKPRMANLEVVYGAESGRGDAEDILPILMILPPASPRIICFMASRLQRNGPVTLTFITQSKSAALSSVVAPPSAVPALFTSKLQPPWSD